MTQAIVTRTEPKNGTAEWTVSLHETVDALEQDWEALSVPENGTNFQRFGLMREFYRQLSRNRLAEPVIAAVRNQSGDIVAIFPMTRTRRHGLNWLSMAELRVMDYCAPILHTSLDAQQVRAIIAAILKATPRADILYCNRIPAHFEGRPNPILALPNTAQLRESAWTFTLKGLSRDQVIAAPQKRMRSSLRSRARKLADKAEYRVAVYSGGEISDAEFSAFRALRTESFGEKGRSNVIDDENWTGFYEGIRNSTRADCVPWLGTLVSEDQHLAVLFGFSDGRRAVAIMPAAKGGAWAEYSPGLLLFQEVILHFHASGVEIFDLSVGNMSYKKRLGFDELTLHDALFPKTIIGWLYYAFWRFKVLIRKNILFALDRRK